ncbi:MAG: transcriptional repressor LexA [Isosphaeraceae bacterium]|nr:transcriptional repressor LexA [Isosphaeraceae bacterium]
MATQPLSKKELEAVRYIQSTFARQGRAPSVREIQQALGYRSPRSASDILERLAERGVVQRRADGRLQVLKNPEGDTSHARTVDIPLVGTAPCGQPLLAEENIEALIPVSTSLARPPHRYFLLRARGDSMTDAGIHDGDLVLVRQQPTATNGEVVVALIDDEATIKEFQRSSAVIVLKPRSGNSVHRPVVLTDDFQIQGVVVSTIPKF